MAYLNFYLQFFAAFSMLIVFEGNIRSISVSSRSRKLFLNMLISDILMLFSGALDNYIIYNILARKPLPTKSVVG